MGISQFAGDREPPQGGGRDSKNQRNRSYAIMAQATKHWSITLLFLVRFLACRSSIASLDLTWAVLRHWQPRSQRSAAGADTWAAARAGSYPLDLLRLWCGSFMGTAQLGCEAWLHAHRALTGGLADSIPTSSQPPEHMRLRYPPAKWAPHPLSSSRVPPPRVFSKASCPPLWVPVPLSDDHRVRPCVGGMVVGEGTRGPGNSVPPNPV